eukprot:2251819-Amphidinium_carterae.2
MKSLFFRQVRGLQKRQARQRGDVDRALDPKKLRDIPGKASMALIAVAGSEGTASKAWPSLRRDGPQQAS